MNLSKGVYERRTSTGNEAFFVLLESFRFYDEYDYEYEIFSVVSSALAWTSVILAGKCGSRRHSATSFSKNVEVAETSYQMLEVLSFYGRESA